MQVSVITKHVQYFMSCLTKQKHKELPVCLYTTLLVQEFVNQDTQILS